MKSQTAESQKPGQRVVFPDETVIFALNIDSRASSDPPPDFGLYLDSAWSRSWKSTVIHWQDFSGAPPDKEHLFESVLNTFQKAKAGQWVEVGCLGGCGRTGTVLGCMAIIGGISADQAVKWVRDNYDPWAVENEGQEHLVTEFAGWLDHATKLNN